MQGEEPGDMEEFDRRGDLIRTLGVVSNALVAIELFESPSYKERVILYIDSYLKDETESRLLIKSLLSERKDIPASLNDVPSALSKICKLLERIKRGAAPSAAEIAESKSFLIALSHLLSSELHSYQIGFPNVRFPT